MSNKGKDSVKMNVKINDKITDNSDDKITDNNDIIQSRKGDKIDNSDDKITDNNDINSIKEGKNMDKKQKLLPNIIGYFFDSAEKNNLDSKKVNKVVKDFQYLFKKDPKQKDIECLTCKND